MVWSTKYGSSSLILPSLVQSGNWQLLWPHSHISRQCIWERGFTQWRCGSSGMCPKSPVLEIVVKCQYSIFKISSSFLLQTHSKKFVKMKEEFPLTVLPLTETVLAFSNTSHCSLQIDKEPWSTPCVHFIPVSIYCPYSLCSLSHWAELFLSHQSKHGHGPQQAPPCSCGQ